MHQNIAFGFQFKNKSQLNYTLWRLENNKASSKKFNQNGFDILIEIIIFLNTLHSKHLP